jgi:hypothetical protein
MIEKRAMQEGEIGFVRQLAFDLLVDKWPQEL